MNRRNALAQVATLLGGTFSAPTLLAMNRWEQLATHPTPEQTGAKPALPALTDVQRETVAQVADLILPRTNTPGAIDAGVPEFIALMLRDCYQQPMRDVFTAGLRDLEEKNFLSLSTDRRIAILKDVEADAQAHRSDANPTFWHLIKELTLLGYYTSEPGIRASFDYQPIPGRFEAIRIKPGQKDFMYGNQA